MTCVVGAGGGKGLCKTWHLFLRFVWGTPWLFFHSVLPLQGHQAPPSMGFSRQEYWSGVPLLLLGRIK